MKFAWITVLSTVFVLFAGCGNDSVKVGSEFDPENASEEQAIIFAARDGDVDALTEYMNQYPELVSAADSTGNMLIHHAAMAGQTRVVALLVEKGADVNALNYDDLTPLGAAMDRKAGESVVAFLKDNGGVE